MNRPLTSFTSVNGEDQLLAAMNDARRSAQRLHNFELLRTEDAYLSTHIGGTNWQTGCTSTPGGTSIIMKRVDEVWNYTTAVIGSTTYYPRTTRIPFSYTGQFKRELPPVDRVLVTNQSPQNFAIQNQFAYTNGNQLFVTTVGVATTYKLVGVKWLDDLTGSESPDIFLTYFIDWFRYATIENLNYYIKDSQRFPIDSAKMEKMWQSVKTMDGDIANMGESSTLE